MKLLRALSNNARNLEKENVILAEALNLLSPKAYRPSLIRNLTKGSAQEQFKANDVLKLDIPKQDHNLHLNKLFYGLTEMLSTKKNGVLDLSDRDLHLHCKTLPSEKDIFDTMRLLYHQDRMTPRVLMELILNKNLVNVKEMPIDVHSLGLSQIEWVHYNIIMLKKWQDLRKPLQVIKNLKENFEGSYYPLIEAQKLSPFYERIVWRFYFEYIKQHNEIFYIEKLPTRSAFLMWESSLAHSKEIAEYMANSDRLNGIQRLFFAVCNSARPRIESEEKTGKSPLLSNLKKISIKYKVYAMEQEGILAASMVNSLEMLVNESESLDLLRAYKEKMEGVQDVGFCEA